MNSKEYMPKVERLGGGKIRGLIIMEPVDQNDYKNHV